MNAIELIKYHEKYRRFPYRCTAGKLTIGYGWNLDEPCRLPAGLQSDPYLKQVRANVQKSSEIGRTVATDFTGALVPPILYIADI